MPSSRVMRRAFEVAAVVAIVGCRATPRTDAVLQTVWASPSPEERDERRQRREERDDFQRRVERMTSGPSDYQKHLQENARRRRSGLPNEPYKKPRPDPDVGERLADRLFQATIGDAAGEMIVRTAATAVVVPVTLTADAIAPVAERRPRWLRWPGRRPSGKYDDWDAEGRWD